MATDLIRKVSDPFEREMLALRQFTDRLWETPLMPVRWLRAVNPFDMEIPAADVEEKGDQYVHPQLCPAR